jgi:hypothetical protein
MNPVQPEAVREQQAVQRRKVAMIKDTQQILNIIIKKYAT